MLMSPISVMSPNSRNWNRTASTAIRLVDKLSKKNELFFKARATPPLDLNTMLLEDGFDKISGRGYLFHDQPKLVTKNLKKEIGDLAFRITKAQAILNGDNVDGKRRAIEVGELVSETVTETSTTFFSLPCQGQRSPCIIKFLPQPIDF